MTHIIKAPKPPRRGPKFGDVPLGGLFLRRGYRARLAKVDPDEHDGFNAVAVAGVARKKMKDDDPVTLLSVQPVTPEPDPDVCTYPALSPADAFRFEGVDDIYIKPKDYGENDARPMCPESGAVSSVSEDTKVRRAHVTIVEHEEPGTALTQCLGGSIRVTREQLAAIVRQGAAFLAQQATSPESGEPRGCDLLCRPHDSATKGGES